MEDELEEELDFRDFLLLDERKFDDFQKAFYYIKDYIEAYKGEDYDIEFITDLVGLIDKFKQFGEPIKEDISDLSLKVLESANNLLSYTHKYDKSFEKDTKTAVKIVYSDFYSNFLQFS